MKLTDKQKFVYDVLIKNYQIKTVKGIAALMIIDGFSEHHSQSRSWTSSALQGLKKKGLVKIKLHGWVALKPTEIVKVKYE